MEDFMLKNFINKTVKPTLALIKNDIHLFNDEVKTQVTVVDNVLAQISEKEEAFKKSKSSGDALKTELASIKKTARKLVPEIALHLKTEYTKVELNVYFHSHNASDIAKDVKLLDDFLTHCSTLLDENEKELTNFKTRISELSVKVKNYLNSDTDVKDAKVLKKDNLNEEGKSLKKEFKALKLKVEINSLTNPKIDFRKYFPVTTRTKKDKPNTDNSKTTNAVKNEKAKITTKTTVKSKKGVKNNKTIVSNAEI